MNVYGFFWVFFVVEETYNCDRQWCPTLRIVSKIVTDDVILSQAANDWNHGCNNMTVGFSNLSLKDMTHWQLYKYKYRQTRATHKKWGEVKNLKVKKTFNFLSFYLTRKDREVQKTGLYKVLFRKIAKIFFLYPYLKLSLCLCYIKRLTFCYHILPILLSMAPWWHLSARPLTDSKICKKIQAIISI